MFGSTANCAAVQPICEQLADAVSTSRVAALLADHTQTLTERWPATSPAVRGKVINEQMIVTVMRGQRGSRTLYPSTVEIHWC
jgi:hypothetical protein